MPLWTRRICRGFWNFVEYCMWENWHYIDEKLNVELEISWKVNAGLLIEMHAKGKADVIVALMISY